MRIFGATLFLVACWQTTTAVAATCESLSSQNLPHTRINRAEQVAAGAFTPPAPEAPGGGALTALPAFCRVVATLTPSPDSRIGVEVWLPVAGWNGKYQAVGNGAWRGSISYAAMAAALRRGYAASSTDTGHEGGSARFGMGHPDKVIVFAYRSVHEKTLVAKALIHSFYGKPTKFSYWTGCSAGGRQALKQAQMFPDDFDGIVAGSPGLDWSGRTAQAVHIERLLQNDERARLSAPKRELLHRAVVAACDGLDGVEDGLIENPAACTFDPGVLACKAGEDSSCLTQAQVTTARTIYSPIVDAKTKEEIPGLARGSELGWTALGWTESARATGLDHLRYLIFADPQWSVQRFNVGADVSRLREGVSGTIDARDPNLGRFFDRGGKLIHYHGWADPQIAPLSSTAYFNAVAAVRGGVANVHQSYRLFLAPGMGHCGGGVGPNSFDALAALERWVEQKAAPDMILASQARDGQVVRTRPLCPFPQVAAYKGSGSIDDARNFACRQP